MKLDDPFCFAEAHARGRSELSGDGGVLECGHLLHRGMGGGGLNVAINLILLTQEEHRNHHAGRWPKIDHLIEAVALRYRVGPIQVEVELRRLQQLFKGSNPNDDRPSWAPAYPPESFTAKPTRRKKAKP